MKHLLLTLLLVSCSTQKDPVEQVSHSNDLTEMREVRSDIYEYISEYQDDYGWFHSDLCDSALYTGLLVASGIKADLSAGVIGGKAYRTPYHDCYSNWKNKIESSRQSKSTISSDSLIGYMWGFYATGQIDEIEKIRRYSKANTWIVGEGDLSRVSIKPNLQKTMYLATNKSYGGLNTIWAGSNNDTERHVIALHIALRGEIEGRIDGDALEVVEGFERQDQRNTLFKFIKHRYTDGDQSETIRMALQQYREYPRGMRCVRWLWERHSDKWDNCETKELSTNSEILFLLMLLERAD